MGFRDRIEFGQAVFPKNPQIADNWYCFCIETEIIRCTTR